WLGPGIAPATLASASALWELGTKGPGAPEPAPGGGDPGLGGGPPPPSGERGGRTCGRRATGLRAPRRGGGGEGGGGRPRGGAGKEGEVKKLLGGAGVVHLATHGELSEDDPLSSAMLLVPGSGEDGRLEVREVFALDLHARLVVLSACETGLGKLSRGDELV